MSITEAFFNQGMTGQEWLSTLKTNSEPIHKIYESVAIPAEATAFFEGLPQPLRLAVFTEPWCADAVTATPTILRLAETTSNLEARCFERDKHRETTDSFLPEHRAGTLPIFVVFDQEMREVARFIETAKELVPALGRMEEEVRQAILAAAEVDKPFGELAEGSRTAVRTGRYAYRVARAREWGEIVVEAFTRTVKQGLALPYEERPAVGGTEWPPKEKQ